MTKPENCNIKVAYESPQCDINELRTEGVLCASLQQLYEYENVYEW